MSPFARRATARLLQKTQVLQLRQAFSLITYHFVSYLSAICFDFGRFRLSSLPSGVVICGFFFLLTKFFFAYRQNFLSTFLFAFCLLSNSLFTQQPAKSRSTRCRTGGQVVTSLATQTTLVVLVRPRSGHAVPKNTATVQQKNTRLSTQNTLRVP